MKFMRTPLTRAIGSSFGSAGLKDAQACASLASALSYGTQIVSVVGIAMIGGRQLPSPEGHASGMSFLQVGMQ